MCIHAYMFHDTHITILSMFSSTFHELTNDIIKPSEMAGDRSKIKTDHAWMGPKRGRDTGCIDMKTHILSLCDR